MSRSGYDCDGGNGSFEFIMWRGAVESALNGARGQAFLKEMLAALDALPDKKLISDELADAEGSVCAMGAVGLARGLDMSKVDIENRSAVGKLFGIAPAMAAEIAWLNDEGYGSWRDAELPGARFQRVRRWVLRRIHPIRMMLECPKCHTPHVDEGEWAIKLHKTHLCLNEACGHQWRPRPYPTVGVKNEPA